MRKILFCLFLLCSFTVYSQDLTNFQLFDPQSNAANDIEQAKVKAKNERKNILIHVGGNWNKWDFWFYNFCCSDLNINLLLSTYVVVRLNYSNENKNPEVLKSLGNPIKYGFPVLVILNYKGDTLHTQETGVFENGESYQSEKIICFLKKWSASDVNTLIINRNIKVKNNSNKALWKLGGKICCEKNNGLICGTINQWNEDKSQVLIKIISSPGGTYEGEDLVKGNTIWVPASGRGWHLCLQDEIDKSIAENQAGGGGTAGGNTSGGGAAVGKNCYWFEELSIDNSDGSLLGAVLSGITAIRYNVRYTGVIEQELGSNYKIIISNAGVELGNYASVNQVKYKNSANEYVQRNMGKSVVKEKSAVKF